MGSYKVEEIATGFNIGQFIQTKKFLRHNANKIKKERAKKAKEIKKKLPKMQTKEQQILIEAMRRKRKKRK
jgi:ribosomal protein S19